MAALGVWWNVLQKDANRQADQAAACSSASQAAPSLDPTTVHLRVLNASDQQVGTQPTDITAEHRRCAVGADEQRQDVKTLRAVVSLESRAGGNRRLDALSDLTRVPWQPVH